MIHRNANRWRRAGVALAVTLTGLTLSAVNADEPMWDLGAGRLEVTSTTFTENGPLPDAVIFNDIYQGLNLCTVNGAPGGDRSPELQWSHVPHKTRSFVVVLYDTTASFTHWGMYNIAADVRMLPEGAGAANSKYGEQIENDFFDFQYDGPCPPPGVPPDAHHYVFTVYALDTELKIQALANFPSNGETLYHALIHAARDGHILASGHIATHYSTTPP